MSVELAEKLAAELGAPLGEVDGRRIVPMLCAPDDAGGAVLTSREHVFELKLDGVRIVADRRGDAVKLSYRRLRDATDAYPEVAQAMRELAIERVVLDGEVVAFDERGHPDFQRLGRRIHAGGAAARRAAAEVPVHYLAFDVLAVGDRDLRRLPLEARRAILEALVPEGGQGIVRVPPVFDDGVAIFRMCVEKGLEGVVAKRRGSLYREGDRSPDWTKVKNLVERDLVVVGWTEGERRRARLGSLDLAAYENGDLVACGSVGSGLDEATIDALLPRLRALEVSSPTARGKRTLERGRRHVRPEIVVSVRFMSLSADGNLRAPVFRGVRPDARIEDCTLARGEAFAPGSDARAEAEARHAPSACVGLRIEGPRGAAKAVAEAARTIHGICTEIGLPAVALASVASAVDVIVPARGAPEEAARALATILAQMVSSSRARVRVLVTAPVPWSRIDPVRVAAPIGWDELEAVVDAGVRAEEALARLSGGGADPTEVLHADADAGLAGAVAELERVVARWAAPGTAR